MNNSLTRIAFILILCTANLTFAQRGEFSGNISIEGWAFATNPTFSYQQKNNSAVSAHFEFYWEFDNGSLFTVVPFARLDWADPQRSHFDIRELNYFLYH